MMKHFWFGEWVNDNDLTEAIEHLDQHIMRIGAKPFPFEDLLETANALAEHLNPGDEIYERLAAEARKTSTEKDVVSMMIGIAATLRRDALLERVRSELGCSRPGILKRKYPGRQFESWMPLGLVIHVMPSNVFAVAALGMVEGLLAGNMNVVKLSARDSAFGAGFAEALCQLDKSGLLKDYIAYVHVSSKDTVRLQGLFNAADGISAWGGEAAIAALRQRAPQGVRFIEWGHKISFGYTTAEILTDPQARDKALEGAARDICRLDQQACSSPQTWFVEGDEQEVLSFARELAEKLKIISLEIPGQLPDGAEQAEITAVMSVARAEQALSLTNTIEDDRNGRWRVIADKRTGLRPSPLYRTIWVKPLPRESIVTVLRPMRAWLQSCGLACDVTALADVSRRLFAAGVTRIARPGEMVDSYTGAPHDGSYALQQLSRRISLDGPPEAAEIGNFAELEAIPHAQHAASPVLHKAEFQAMSATIDKADLIFRSGGSSGKFVYSKFSWEDYHDQMECAAHGLLAAGLNPARDMTANLYAAGYLYGSFISFWTILEKLHAPQLPLTMIMEYDQIADLAIENKANVLIGLPSHLLGLFSAEKNRLKGTIEKVFFGGERMTRAQRDFLHNECGVKIIRSSAYGSNDAGPMGYQCPHCEPGVHHLMSAIQHLEIVDMDDDNKPMSPGQTGRLLFTSSARSYPKVVRYEIGDTGRWIDKTCPCGRRDPLFELQGRTGDVFKAGGPFFNYHRFVSILDEQLNYSGPVQLHIQEDKQTTVLKMLISDSVDTSTAEQAIREHYEEINFAEVIGLSFRFEVASVPDHEFEHVTASGKIRPICDHR
jgi:phenylacetate-coenzyme A ligase PaaK-like adenylate-forming protein/acyl-CoA reductase-like NAD-dependent aldehyde dehydrogenase